MHDPEQQPLIPDTRPMADDSHVPADAWTPKDDHDPDLNRRDEHEDDGDD